MTRRIISALCIVCMLLCLAACQKEVPDQEEKETTLETQEQTLPATEPTETEETAPEVTEPPVAEEPEDQTPEELLPALSAIEKGDYEIAYGYLIGLENKSDAVKALLSCFAFAPVSVETKYENHMVTVSYTYDSNGFMTKQEYGYGQEDPSADNRQLYTHDEKGNVLTELYVSDNGDGTTTQLEYTYTYDDNGNLIKLIKTPGDYTAIYTYDNNGNLLSKVEPDYVSSYTYDENGNIIKQRNERSTGAWDEIIKEYDTEGNLTGYSHQYSGASSTSKISYAYDDRGNRISKYEEDGAYWSMTEYTYDSSDRLIAQVSSNKNVSRMEEIRYTYDEKGNLITIADVTYPYNHYFAYDDWGNLITMDCDATDEAHGHKQTAYTYQLFYYPNGVPEQIQDLVEAYIPADLYH